jgi:hypothetical protein
MKIRSSLKYDYHGPELSEEKAAEVWENISNDIMYKYGKPVEGFRYYKGIPDYIGR